MELTEVKVEVMQKLLMETMKLQSKKQFQKMMEMVRELLMAKISIEVTRQDGPPDREMVDKMGKIDWTIECSKDYGRLYLYTTTAEGWMYWELTKTGVQRGSGLAACSLRRPYGA